MMKKVLGIIVISFIFIAAALSLHFFYRLKTSLGELDFSRPPGVRRYVYDYARIMSDWEESVEPYLANIEKNYKVQAVIVTIPGLQGELIQVRAVELLNNWKIGKRTAGRGIVLLLSAKEKEVKLEVSYELEDVFSDAFCHYIEERQLKHYFLSGQIGIGLLAMMEEVDKRVALKYRGEYSPRLIRELDDKLLSGGGGARKRLTEFGRERIELTPAAQCKAGDSPWESWKILVQSWKDKLRSPDLDVYSECTKLIYRDFTDRADSRFEESVRDYTHKRFTVRPQPLAGKHAVIFFSNEKGWDNPPFLFAKINGKWKFDIVSMRKFVRYGNAPHWGIEWTPYNPYAGYLHDCSLWLGQDMPLEDEDIYRIADDVRHASEIVRLEGKLKEDPQDYETLINLSRLYTVASLGPKTLPILKRALARAEELKLGDSRPYKYLAIFHVDAFYQYQTSIKYTKKFLELEPRSIFGHNFLGYLYYEVGQYRKAIAEFKESVELKPDNNCYAYCKLARCYGKFSGPLNLAQAKKWFERAKTQKDCHSYRLNWVEHNLKNKNP